MSVMGLLGLDVSDVVFGRGILVPGGVVVEELSLAFVSTGSEFVGRCALPP